MPAGGQNFKYVLVLTVGGIIQVFISTLIQSGLLTGFVSRTEINYTFLSMYMKCSINCMAYNSTRKFFVIWAPTL